VLVDMAGERGACWPSNSVLARRCNVERRIVAKWLGDLERHDRIVCRRLRRGADLPGTDGEIVEGSEVRVVYLPSVWQCPMTGEVYDRRAPAQRARRQGDARQEGDAQPTEGCTTEGDARATERNDSAVHGGDAQMDIRKGDLYIEGDMSLVQDRPLLVPVLSASDFDGDAIMAIGRELARADDDCLDLDLALALSAAPEERTLAERCLVSFHDLGFEVEDIYRIGDPHTDTGLDRLRRAFQVLRSLPVDERRPDVAVMRIVKHLDDEPAILDDGPLTESERRIVTTVSPQTLRWCDGTDNSDNTTGTLPGIGGVFGKAS